MTCSQSYICDAAQPFNRKSSMLDFQHKQTKYWSEQGWKSWNFEIGERFSLSSFQSQGEVEMAKQTLEGALILIFVPV